MRSLSRLFLFAVFYVHSLSSAALVRTAASGDWSQAATWESGAPPTAGDSVLIRPGHRVVYDVASETVLRAVHIGGVLTFSREKDTLLCAGLIRIAAGEDCKEEGFDCHAPASEAIAAGPQPALEVGTGTAPIPAQHKAVLRLTYIEGMDRQSFPALVCCGGRMDLHGAPLNRSWVKLGSSATRGSREIELSEPVTGWKPGDHVLFPTTEMSEFYQVHAGRRVIPSLLDDTETEDAEIAAVEGAGLLLREPLKFKHQAIGQFRGEVANLSRNVIVESADPQGVRGHTMYHKNSAGSISYVEFRHLGKKDVLGRYPVHFHLCGDTMRGSSVIGASIWDSENRWLTVHDADYLVVRDCVGYRSIGHGFFFEDGTEVDNVFDRNLAVQAFMGKPLPQQDLTFDTNDGAGFWWANCANSFTRNVAVECGKFGYRFQMVKTATFSPELSVRQADGTTRKVDVRTLPFLHFEQNEAHSQRRFAFNLGGFHGQNETADLDRDGNVIDRASYLGGDVQGVGPDSRHPFRIKDYLVWNSHWGFHTAAPNVQIQGFTAHDVNYAVWRSNVAGHDYNDLHFSDLHVSSFFNGWGASASRENLLRYVDPQDDAPPVTVITDCRPRGSDRVQVSGIAIDNEDVREVRVNGEPAILQPGLVREWTQSLPFPGDSLEISATATDAKGNRELTPHRVVLRRSAAGFEITTLKTSPPNAAAAASTEPMKPMSARMMAYGAEGGDDTIRESPVDPASLKWPLWNGHESIAEYAQRRGVAPTKTLDLHGSKLELVLVPAGSFLMGSAAAETGAQADEHPQHRVVISRPFYLAKYELTQAQYAAITGVNPSYFPAPDHPVEQVSWEDAQAFVQKAGQGLRLPTEAEWEFACRAGTTTAFSTGNDSASLSKAGWWGYTAYDEGGNAPSGTSAVGQKAANAFGLYDMHGNVYEWCADAYLPDFYRRSPVLDPQLTEGGDERVIRGGAWEGSADKCRSANRNAFSPHSRGFLLGFRVACPLPEK